MDRQEFENTLKDFEINVLKRLPSMINITLTNRGNREQETSFNHFIETLKRQRTMLLKDIPKLAKPPQKIRYFNVVYNMDSQLRSMGNRDVLKDRMRMRRHALKAPIIYDIGKGPEDGELLNVFENGVLLKTTEKVSIDHEVMITISGKSAKGKAIWSIPAKEGNVETGVRLIDIPDDLIDELNRWMHEKG